MKPSARPDPLDELRRANPDTRRRSPSDSRARIWARIQEVTMQNKSKRSVNRRIALGLGLGSVAVAGVAALALTLNPRPAPTPSNDPGPGIGSCVETYSADTLANRDFAFDGTVAAIDRDQVTFTVNERFAGSGGEEATLTATGRTGTSITSAGGPSLTAGQRYLVAGDDTFAWACGFTQPYDAAAAAEWADATR